MTPLDRARTEARQTLRLTPRWTPLKPHHQQALFYWHPARFKVNPSGRRSGKTELSKRKAIPQLLKSRAWPARLFYAAPSFGQAKDIFWEDLKALIPPWWVASIRESDLEIRTHWGALVRVFGFDRPRRIEGVPWDWGCIDEIADTPPRAFGLNVRPALSTLGREGGCDLIGVPDEVGRNQAEYEDLYETGMAWDPDPALARDPDICSFHWESSDILAAEEIEALGRGMDRLAFDQELRGRFVRSGGKALPDFDPAHHVRSEYCIYDRGLRLDWSLDFGYRVGASLLCQTYKGHVWVMDEIAVTDTSTGAQVAAMLELVQKRGYSLRRLGIFGDAAGKTHHSATGESDYKIIDQQLRDLPDIEWNNLDANPPIKDSVNAVRGRLVSADNVVHLHVHPRCEHLIENMKQAPWPSDLSEYHWLAALRYYCFKLFGSAQIMYSAGQRKMENLGGAATTGKDLARPLRLR